MLSLAAGTAIFVFFIFSLFSKFRQFLNNWIPKADFRTNFGGHRPLFFPRAGGGGGDSRPRDSQGDLGEWEPPQQDLPSKILPNFHRFLVLGFCKVGTMF